MEHNVNKIGTREKGQAERKPWQSFSIVYVGHVAQVLQGGGGKLSRNANDQGDSRKPPGQG